MHTLCEYMHWNIFWNELQETIISGMGAGVKRRKEALTFILYLLLIKFFILYMFYIWHLKNCQQQFPFLYFSQLQYPEILFGFFLYVYNKDANMHLCICTIIIFVITKIALYRVLQFAFPILYTIHIFPFKDITHKISQ